jgi:HJR/Mrr/RecB family endonuclease
MHHQSDPGARAIARETQKLWTVDAKRIGLAS